MNKRFTGLGVALITPFTEHGAIDFPGLERMVHHVAGSKAHFLVVLGSTGEAQLMKTEEHRRVLDFVQEVNHGRLPIVAGFDTSGGTSAAVNRLEAFDHRGLDGLLMSAPPYIKPSQKGILAHFSALSKVSPLPIVLYNVPSRAGVVMSPDTIVEIANTCPQVVALKQAYDDLVDFRKIRQGAPESFVLLSGDDANAIPMMALGGEGLISVIGNAYPDAWAEAMDLGMFGSVKEAEQRVASHQALLEVLFAEGNPTGIKAVCDLLGLCGPHLRLPLMPASSNHRDILYRAMAQMDSIPQRSMGLSKDS